MKVLFIGSDRSIFEEDSSSRKRMMDYAELFTELHIIIFGTKRYFRELDIIESKKQISQKLWIYPTHSFSRWFYPIDAVKIAKKCFGKDDVDIISVQDPFEAGFSGVFLKYILNAKLHIQVHTDIFSPYFARFSKLNLLRKLLSKFVFHFADGVRVVSEHLEQHLIKRYKYLTGKITVLPIFVDVEKIRNTEPEFDLHERFPEFSHIILMVGRLEKEKNIETAIDVMSEVLKKYPEAGLVIVGDGSQRAQLEEYANQKRIASNVVFEGHKSNIASYYKTADIFFHTSLYEGAARVFSEASASSLPIISSDVGSLKSIAPNEKKSFVCMPLDQNCFVEKVNNALEAKKNGYGFVEKKLIFNQEENYLEYLVAHRDELKRILDKET